MPPVPFRPYYQDDAVTIYNATAEALLESMPSSSIDLIVTDPPYFKVKADWWDHQWEKPEAFLAWIGAICDEWQRVLKPNGSLYVFASPQMAWVVEGEVRKRFNVLTNIRWRKPPYSTKAEMFDKDDLRSPFPASETVIFAEQFGSDSIAKGEAGYLAKCDELRGFVFEPLRKYLAGEWERAELTSRDANMATGSQMAGHWLSSVQWTLPTADKYEQLQKYANRNSGDYLLREYEDLRREYEDLRVEYEELRRPFYASENRPYTDVWDFKTVNAYEGKHPCEKPLRMIEHIVETSSRPDATVLDCFSGSGVTGRACKHFGRNAILCDVDENWCKIAAKRLSQGVLF